MVYEVFISYAGEDRDGFVQPLAENLRRLGIQVWYDKFVLQPGDRLRQRIDEGLRTARYGVVVLSPSFFRKNWPQYELDGLVARENANGELAILPIWHTVTHKDVASYSLILADRVAITSSDGIELVAQKIAQVVASATRSEAAPARTDSEGETESDSVIYSYTEPSPMPAAVFVSFSGDLIKSAIGKPISSEPVQELLGLLGRPTRAHGVYSYDKDMDYIYYAHGVDLRFSPGRHLIALFLYSGRDEKRPAYQGTLPRGLHFDDGRGAVENKLGKPDTIWANAIDPVHIYYTRLGLGVSFLSSHVTDPRNPISYVGIHVPG